MGNSFLPHFMGLLDCDVAMLHLLTALSFRLGKGKALLRLSEDMCSFASSVSSFLCDPQKVNHHLWSLIFLI